MLKYLNNIQWEKLKKANVNRKESYTGTVVNGIVGCGGNPSSTVEVNAKFGNINLMSNK